MTMRATAVWTARPQDLGDYLSDVDIPYREYPWKEQRRAAECIAGRILPDLDHGLLTAELFEHSLLTM
jgi:hypothetical protein